MTETYIKHFSLDESVKRIKELLIGGNKFNERKRKSNPNVSLVKQLSEVIAKGDMVYAYSELSREYGRVLYFDFYGGCKSIAKAYVEIDCHWDSYEEEVLRPKQRGTFLTWTADDMAKVKICCELWSVGYCKFFYINNGELVSLEGANEVDNRYNQ